jgi:hypothetical protein
MARFVLSAEGQCLDGSHFGGLFSAAGVWTWFLSRNFSDYRVFYAMHKEF